MPLPGWLELVVVTQTIMPALMFINSLQSFRVYTRIASFAIALLAWGWYVGLGKSMPGRTKYAATVWLTVVAGWMTFSIVHPTCNTIASAACQVLLAMSIYCPAFWAPMAMTDSRQLPRLMLLLFLCNAASALIGLGQVYWPGRFMPSKMAITEWRSDMNLKDQITVKGDDGLEYTRPPGLTDTPGGAAIGGAASCLIGLAIVVSPIAWWKRAVALALSVLGLVVVFYSQVRSMLLTLILGIGVWAIILVLRREVKKLALLGICVTILGFGGVGWVLRSGGASIFARLGELLEDKATTVYYKNRGAYIEGALTVYVPRYPLGAGPGRTGMSSVYFGNPLAPSHLAPIYAETQIEVWVLDGGLPLLIFYPLAILVAFCSALRIALRCPDENVAYWAGVVVIYGVFIAAACLGGQPFMAPMGVQFWTVFGALHGAQECSRAELLRASGLPRAK